MKQRTTGQIILDLTLENTELKTQNAKLKKRVLELENILTHVHVDKPQIYISQFEDEPPF